MSIDQIQDKEEARAKRREKKKRPSMRVSGKGMKRFAKPKQRSKR